MLKNKIKAFTLAEVMVVMGIIGVLAGILMPVINASKPDENVMKFKKANATLGNVIRELVTNSRYFKDGNLGLKPNGDSITYGSDDAYYCESFANIVTIKSKHCNGTNYFGSPMSQCTNAALTATPHQACDLTKDQIVLNKKFFDDGCKYAVTEDFYNTLPNVVLDDGVVVYQASVFAFGSYGNNYFNNNGIDVAYGVLCIDVDGVPANATSSDCKNECPFGYGIRADGRILPGARADEWQEKNFQKGKK